MRERLLTVLTMQIPERAIEKIPAWQAAVDELRASVDLEIYSWPLGKDSPEDPSWETVVEDMVALITPDTHVYAQVSLLPLIAIGRAGGAASLIQHPVGSTPATLRAAGYIAIADALEGMMTSAFSTPRSAIWGLLRQTFPDASDDETAPLADIVAEEYEQGRFQMIGASTRSLNALAEVRPVEVPTQVWKGSIELPGILESRQIFLSLVPGAELIAVPLPGFHDRVAGVAYAQQMLRFIERHPATSTLT
jgi:hypothetical protein